MPDVADPRHGQHHRHHAQILESHGTYFLEDLRSRNGTLLNGKKIQGRTELGDRDEIRVCEVVLRYYQGMPDDYDELDRHGISVKARIVIARYGGGWRGLKPKLAHEHGAIGCIIYSDPHDDGYAVGDVYPGGGYRPPDGVQRGSVQDLPIYPGDPLTPGRASRSVGPRL